MITLYGFGKNLGLIDASPFVSKVHAFLNIAKLEYKTVPGQQNLGKSPKGKLPFIEDGENAIGDSQSIIEYLTDQYSLTLDDHLSEEEKASAYLISKSLDENLYWCLVWSRWIQEDAWITVKPAFFSKLPFPLSSIVPPILRRKVKKSLYAQGTGRHSEQEIIEIGNKSFAALSTLLGDKSFFFGDKVSTFDATAFAFISSFTHADLDSAINDKAKSYENLVAYVDRIKQLYFS